MHRYMVSCRTSLLALVEVLCITKGLVYRWYIRDIAMGFSGAMMISHISQHCGQMLRLNHDKTLW